MAKQKFVDLVATLDAETAQFDKKVGKSGQTLKKYGSEASKAEKGNESLSSSFKGAASSALSLPGPLGKASSEVDFLVGSVSQLSTVYGIAGTAAAAFVGSVAAGLPILAETERRMLQQEQLLRATGYASGYTAEQLDKLARSVAMSTLTSTEEASKAIGVMLTFRSVMNDQNDTFQRSIYLAQDMASVMGTDITSAAKQLGKALELPSVGMTALRESGMSFTNEQREMAKSLEETGRLADAQLLILKELEGQIEGSAGAEAGGLIGSVDSLGQSVDEAFEAFTKWTGFGPKLQSLIDATSGKFTIIKDFFDPTTTDEALDLMSERVKLIQQMNSEVKKAGGQSELSRYFGYTKSDWFNDQRRVNEIDARLDELKAKRDAQLQAEKEAQDKAAAAAAAREKARSDAAKAAEEKKAKEQTERENKRQKEKEAREEEANKRKRRRDKQETADWLVKLSRRNMDEYQLLDAKYSDELLLLQQRHRDALVIPEEYETALSDIKAYYAAERKELLEKELEEQQKAQKGSMEAYYQSMQEAAFDTDELWRKTFDNFTTGFGNAFASAIMQSESVGDAFRTMAQGMAQSMLAALGKIIAQRLVMMAMEKTMMKQGVANQVSQVTAEAQSSSKIAAINAYKSTAAIPYTGPSMAPAAAASAMAFTEPLAAAASTAAASGFAGMFDNGGYIPAGSWGITGELGPEITHGPTNIIGRKKTMEMLQSVGSSSVPIIQNFNLPAGHTGYDDQSLRELSQAFRQITREEMINEMRDGGILS